MIFGFNTDIKHDDTVFHVQSEAREAEQLLQTQVFVRGRCIGKHATSYSGHFREPNFSDEMMHELLKAQHRSIIDAIRAGRLEQTLRSNGTHADSTESTTSSDGTQPELSGSADGEFDLEFLNPDALAGDGAVVLRFRVAENSTGVAGAKLISKLFAETLPHPVFTQAVTGQDGIGELKIVLEDSPREASFLVQASLEGRITTRKFILRPAK